MLLCVANLEIEAMEALHHAGARSDLAHMRYEQDEKHDQCLVAKGPRAQEGNVCSMLQYVVMAPGDPLFPKGMIEQRYVSVCL
jgi:hypothetical protein